MAEFLKFIFSGITVGAIYALVGLGFSIISNASQVINFAQGEYVMIGGLATAVLVAGGTPLPLAADMKSSSLRLLDGPEIGDQIGARLGILETRVSHRRALHDGFRIGEVGVEGRIIPGQTRVLVRL